MDTPTISTLSRFITTALHADYFSLLGVSPSFVLDNPTKAKLRANYQILLQKVHPDAVASINTADAQSLNALSVQVSAHINDALRTLSSPILRAQYLLQMSGNPFVGTALSSRTLSPQFIAEQMEWREKVEETRTESALQVILAEVENHLTAAELTLSKLFSQSADIRTLPESSINAIGHAIREYQYWSKLHEVIEEKLSGL